MASRGSPKTTLPFWCDLVQHSIAHRSFLQTIHRFGVSLTPLPYDSLRRYRDLWLPLVHHNPFQQLIPPPDIAWLWHCHRLAPRDYVRYVKERFGPDSLLEACPPFALQGTTDCQQSLTANAVATCSLWEQEYSSEPFFLSQALLDPLNSLQSNEETWLIGGFDLLGSTTRQATFLWQISGKHYDDHAFLEQGQQNYYKFLTLCKIARKQDFMLVPTIQIDLMWHTHILCSISKYDDDCKAITGSTFHHDDSLCDRTPGGLQDLSYRKTKQLWFDVYRIDYAVPGGMYQGEPSEEFFRTSWIKERDALCNTNSSIPLKWASVHGTTSDGSRAFISANTTVRKELKSLPKLDNYILGKTSFGTGYYHLETREANEIIAQRVLRHCTSLEYTIAMERCCCGSSKSIARYEKDLLEARQLYVVMVARSRA